MKNYILYGTYLFLTYFGFLLGMSAFIYLGVCFLKWDLITLNLLEMLLIVRIYAAFSVVAAIMITTTTCKHKIEMKLDDLYIKLGL